MHIKNYTIVVDTIQETFGVKEPELLQGYVKHGPCHLQLEVICSSLQAYQLMVLVWKLLVHQSHAIILVPTAHGAEFKPSNSAH